MSIKIEKNNLFSDIWVVSRFDGLGHKLAKVRRLSLDQL